MKQTVYFDNKYKLHSSDSCQKNFENATNSKFGWVRFPVLDLQNVTSPLQQQPIRYKFTSKYHLHYILVGLVSNYGTLFRIPCGVYQHGASFVGAYIILLVVLGYPLTFLEVHLGQYHTRGPYNIFRICPFFEGK